MEVHAHSHTPRKKRTHYLWEFIMLFLAVFCGFLAENQREHMVEHVREKQYMQSMVEDLALDSAYFSRTIAFVDTSLIPLMDTSLEILYHKDISSASVKHEMYKFVPRCHHILNIVIADKTTSQLKSSDIFPEVIKFFTINNCLDLTI